MSNGNFQRKKSINIDYCSLLNDGNTQEEYTIEQHLHSFSNQEHYKNLWSTWITEKEMYRKRLETISNTFETYSTHNSEHSEIIISRIEAVLGVDRIRLLSPTDAWLILQCAYTHDIGMCVSQDEKDILIKNIADSPDNISELFQNEDFKDFLISLDNTHAFDTYTANSRQSAARFILRKIEMSDEEEKKRFVDHLKRAEYTKAQDIYSSITMDFFRKRHAKRSMDILLKEANDSTYKDIFPNRLRKIVACIDYSHGCDWNYILKELPRRNNGFHTDYIHPQFIAALLRLGDLLDIDSNRFNPYLLDYTCKMPLQSAIHKLKHMAVTEFLVDSKEINIEARFNFYEAKAFLDKYYFKERNELAGSCNQDDCLPNNDVTVKEIINNSAKSLRSWFNWIRDDLSVFTVNWNSIIPDDMTGSITALRKNDIYLFDSKKPLEDAELDLRYRISPSRASQIIEGSDLYNHPLTFIRELVQNAIDATKKQLFRNAKINLCLDNYQINTLASNTQEAAKIEYDIFNLVQKLKEHYIVSVKFDYVYSSTDSKQLPYIDIIVSDNGIGITYQKLKQMRNIGAVTVSPEEKENLECMPAWLLPTGEFGIGMQSIFTIADWFKIETYPRYEKGRTDDLKRIIKLYCTELSGDIVNFEEKKMIKPRKTGMGLT